VDFTFSVTPQRSQMPSHVNRWTLALTWTVLMSAVWTLFVPRGLSVATFVMFGTVGLLVLFAGGALLSDSQPPRSVNRILAEIEAGPRRNT
jgi:hypothetical protein